MSTTIEPTQEQRREEPEPEQGEFALADLDLTEQSAGEVTGGRVDVTGREKIAVYGKCPPDGCSSNHNEVLAVTA